MSFLFPEAADWDSFTLKPFNPNTTTADSSLFTLHSPHHHQHSFFSDDSNAPHPNSSVSCHTFELDDYQASSLNTDSFTQSTESVVSSHETLNQSNEAVTQQHDNTPLDVEQTIQHSDSQPFQLESLQDSEFIQQRSQQQQQSSISLPTSPLHTSTPLPLPLPFRTQSHTELTSFNSAQAQQQYSVTAPSTHRTLAHLQRLTPIVQTLSTTTTTCPICNETSFHNNSTLSKHVMKCFVLNLQADGQCTLPLNQVRKASNKSSVVNRRSSLCVLKKTVSKLNEAERMSLCQAFKRLAHSSSKPDADYGAEANESVIEKAAIQLAFSVENRRKTKKKRLSVAPIQIQRSSINSSPLHSGYTIPHTSSSPSYSPVSLPTTLYLSQLPELTKASTRRQLSCSPVTTATVVTEDSEFSSAVPARTISLEEREAIIRQQMRMSQSSPALQDMPSQTIDTQLPQSILQPPLFTLD